MSRFALASVLATAEAATLALTYSDCGSKHGKFTGLSPTKIQTGSTETVIGTGTVDEDVASGKFTATVSALGTQLTSCSGDGTSDIVCKLPLGVGTITVKALTFPLAKGAISIPVEVKTAASIPSSLANVDIHVGATDQNGESAICLDVHTKALALALTGKQPSFDEWAAEYGMNDLDDTTRTKYEANVGIIDALNARDSSATYAVNKFSGMTHEEFASIYLTLKTSPLASAGLPELQLESVNAAQDADWDVTPVKDQGSCGSCWTFGVMGAIEGMNKVTTGTEVILSEQQLVDCDNLAFDHLNDGCNGGITDYAYKYLTGKDLYTLGSYPYVSGQSGHSNSCQTGTPSGVAISGYFSVPGSNSGSQGDDGLAKALLTGPVTITIAADNQFSNYHSGIMTGVPTQCTLNHAILATGFGPNFWKIKNSWGASWGAQGFAKFERSTAGCGPFGIFHQDAGFQPKMVQGSISV